MRIEDENIRGRQIVASDGRQVGSVTGLSFETTTWNLHALQVKLVREMAEELGAEHTFFRAGEIEIPVRMVQSIGDSVVLSVPASALSELHVEHAEKPAPAGASAANEAPAARAHD